ncbi:L,D-transpeptidase family protein [Segnochrobactrum spirostomi]|nr:L,D-transpeptidase family protein [Segnochrobactrum spirostomi]
MKSGGTRSAVSGATGMAQGTTRRAFLGGCALALLSTSALAQSMGGAEWADRFDASMPTLQNLKSTQPMLSPETASQTERAIQTYQQIVQRGGWPTVPDAAQGLRLGKRDPSVTVLRQRLLVTGDLAQNSGRTDTFDSYVDGAVRRFQIRHGLQADGVVGASTLQAMNVPADVRLHQLEINLVRLRSLSGDLGYRHVTVNIPGAEIETVEGGQVYSRHIAVVGKIDRQTPILSSKITQINFNPYWHVPVSIIRKDLIPKMQKDPNYLTRNKIHIYNGKGRELQASDIDWNTDQAMQFQFRQDSGPDNSMGSVKITFSNPYDVYMHDTPSKSLFGQDARFHSSGCVRVQNVRQYIGWLLKGNPQWPSDKIDQVIRNGDRIDAQVSPPVPLYFVYITAWENREGIVNFREDIYDKDGLGTANMSADASTDSAAVTTASQNDSRAQDAIYAKQAGLPGQQVGTGYSYPPQQGVAN